MLYPNNYTSHVTYKNVTRAKAKPEETRVAIVVAKEKEDVPGDDAAGRGSPGAQTFVSAPPLIVSLIGETPGEVKYKTSGVEESVFKRIGPFDTAS